MRFLTVDQLNSIIATVRKKETPWPVFPPIAPLQPLRRINVSRLPNEQKKSVWRYLQQHEPQTAKLVLSDNVQALIKMFDADLMLPANIIKNDAS